MILVDLNQVMIANLMMQIGNHKNIEIEPDLIRHMVLNSLRSYRSKYGDKYGELVIAADNRKYWRRDIFPYYKAHRKKAREASELDWKAVFDCLHQIKAEIAENFPYKVIDVDGAEADDVIGTLCARYSAHENVLILSGDKDFMQLQRYPNVDQFSPHQKKWVRTDDAMAYLKEHIIRGDKGDGIPNFLSPDDIFVTGGRQKPISSKRLNETFMPNDPVDFCDQTMLRNYKRNEMLVDLTQTPQEIKDNIIERFENYEVPPRSGLLNYFIKNRLKGLMENIQDF
jgi:hypothetical protein